MRGRFHWLDLGRGLAAFCVMLYHYEEYLGVRPLFGNAFLAVDLFFIMSGFVLSHAYGARIEAGMTTSRYMLLRLIRLYPLYLSALLLGFTYYTSKIVLGTDDAPSATDMLALFTLGVSFIPNVDPGTIPSGMFPFSPASWSLCVELVLSLLYGSVLVRLQSRRLVAIAVLSGVAFAVFVQRFGTVDLGWDARTFMPSMFRGIAEFTVGILIYRLVRSRPLPGIAAHAQGAAPLLLLLCTGVLMTAASLPLSVLALLLLFPCFVLVQALSPVDGAWASISEWAGKLSYPMYLFHTPVLLWGTGVTKLLFGRDPAVMGSGFGICLAVATTVLSLLAAVLIDDPVQAWAKRHLRRKAAVPQRAAMA